MDILVKQVNVFDGNHAELKKHQNMVIRDGLIQEITGNEISEERFGVILDGKGKTAIPGLVDSHVHFGVIFPAEKCAETDYAVALSAKMASEVLHRGFTTVRDAGGVTNGLKTALDQGVLEGPRIFSSGAAISQTSGHGDSSFAHAKRAYQYDAPAFSVLADGPSEVIRAVREQLYRGAAQIKIMAGGGFSSLHDPISSLQYSEQEMRAAVETASDFGTYVMAHVYTPEAMLRALNAGVKSLEHGHLINREVAEAIADKGVFLMPGPQANKPGLPIPKEARALLENESLASELITQYHIKILFGTDLMITGPDTKPQQSIDLSIYKKRFGSFNGLRAATGYANEIIKDTTSQNPYPDGKIGVLEEGSYADLLLVDGNPVEDLDLLSNTDNIRVIMKNAEIYKNTL